MIYYMEIHVVRADYQWLQITGNYKGFPGLIKGYRGLQVITLGVIRVTKSKKG